MQVLVVVAHPKSDSLTQALAAEFRRGLLGAGHEPIALDLYATGFDPVVPAWELSSGPARPLDPVVQEAQSYLRATQGLALVYPVWWGAPPAILQGWLQRVMTPGFAFQITAGRPQGQLRHKVQLLLTAGGTDRSITDRYAEPLIESLRFCGMQAIKAHINHGIFPGAPVSIIQPALAAAFEAGQGF
jgi:putative NADPH-quinone reductase